MSSNAPVLVPGAHGFVGPHLLDALAGEGVPADADVTDADAVAQAVRETRPRAGVPLAAVSLVASSRRGGGGAASGGADTVVARSFNHEGPGRDERFAVGSWTRQIARLEDEGGGVLEVGDLSVERDLTDVR